MKVNTTQLKWRMFKVNRLEFEKGVWVETRWHVTQNILK